MTPQQLALVTEWHRAQATLRQWETYERDLRTKVVHSFFGDYGDGTQSADVGNGFTLRNVNTTKYTVKNSDALLAMMQRIADYKLTASLAPALLNWKPDLSVRTYKLLPADVRGQFDAFVTTKPNAPQLSIIAPEK